MNEDDPAHDALLTPDDHRLLRIIGTGLSAAEAADLLGEELSAVAVQLAQIRRALNVGSTTAAIRVISGRRL
ncbi:hypothetical protein OG218_00555 [Kineococcus sp. NBC_00420]|uniref:hypothetical protein n=1 Tax=Kineococcus sp. NBC_00420 TaxID=2903564 RepID=UPI002E1C7A90